MKEKIERSFSFWSCLDFLYIRKLIIFLLLTFLIILLYHKKKSLPYGNTYWECSQRHSGNGCRHHRILIFGSTESLNFLESSAHWFMDGTFVTVPEQFAQLYTVHGLHRGRNVVGACGLLPNKRIETYIELLTQIQILTNQVNPDSVLIDFEQSVISAMDRIYPIVPQKGWLFYLCQNVYRRVQQEGLSHLYLKDYAFRTNIRMKFRSDCRYHSSF